MDTSFLVDKRELKALAAFVSKDYCRTHLANLYFFDDGTLAASCGHTLVIREPRPKGLDASRPKRKSLFGIPRQSLDRLIGVLGPKFAVKVGPVVEGEPKHRTWGEFEVCEPGPSSWQGPGPVVMKGQIVLDTKSEPPDFFKILPKLENVRAAGKVGFNLDYLKKVDLVRVACGHRAGRGVEMYPPRGELDPAVFRVDPYGSEKIHWLAVIMPLRI